MFSTPRTPAATPSSGLRPRMRGGSGIGGLNKSSMLGTPSALASTSLNASLTTAAASAALSSSGMFSLQMVASSAPVLVTEILTTAENPSDVSVCLSPSGWAWLVHGRRLLIWRYQHQQQQQGHPAGRAAALGHLTTCRELTLPPSDLAHAARLVNVFSAPGSEGANHTPSCIAISPEGENIVQFFVAWCRLIERCPDKMISICKASFGSGRASPTRARRSSRSSTCRARSATR